MVLTSDLMRQETKAGDDSTLCELEIISHEFFAIGDTLATYGRLNPPAFRIQKSPTIN